MDSKAMYKLSYGLFVLSAKTDIKDNGCITNTAIQVTSDPNRISLAVNKSNYTHDMLKETGLFNVSVLSEDANFDTFKRFGFQSGRDVDKFADYNFMARSANGIYYITEGTNAYVSGKVINTIDLVTHTLFIADVTEMDVLSSTPSATYTYYQEHIKPKPQDPVKKTGKVVWRCTVCGYIYEGEELPPDFICPICSHPASDFERVEL